MKYTKRLLIILQSDKIYFNFIAILLFLIGLNNYLFILFLVFYIFIFNKKIIYVFLFSILILLSLIFMLNKYSNKNNIVDNNFYIVDKTVYDYSYNYTVKRGNVKYNISLKENFKLGTYLRIQGKIRLYDKQKIPNGFDASKYYYSKGIKGTIIDYNYTKLEKTNFLYKFNIKNFDLNNVYLNSLLGNDDFTDEQENIYSTLNILHYFSLSGIHIYFLLTFIMFFLLKFNVNESSQFRVKMFVITFLLIFSIYSLTIIRIFIYEIIKKMFYYFNIKINNFISLNITFLLIIFLNINLIYNSNFLVSYLIVIAIFLFRPIYSNDDFIIKTIKINLIITIITLPFFNSINLFTIILSPITFLIVIYIILPLQVISYFSPTLHNTTQILTKFLEDGLTMFTRFNLSIYLPKIHAYLILVYFILIIIFINSSKVKKAFISFILIILLISPYIFRIIDEPKLYFLDVGQGDTAIFMANNKVVVIDSFTGVENFLKSNGVNKIDYLILTHSHEDHIKESQSLINKFEVSNLILSKYDNGYNLKTKSTTKVINSSSKNLITKNDFSMLFYGPLRNYHDINNNSLVFKLIYDDNTVLFTGDIELEAEIDLVNKYGYELKSDLLKVAHHGSKTSTSDLFLNYVNPLNAVISVGKDNKYNLPNIEITNKLYNSGISIYNTSINNTIIFYKKKIYLLNG